jgi:hypothetical protein
VEGSPDEVDPGRAEPRSSVDPVPIVRHVPGCAIPPTVPSHHRSTRRRCRAVSEFSSLRTSSPTIRSGCFSRTRLPAPATRWLRTRRMQPVRARSAVQCVITSRSTAAYDPKRPSTHAITAVTSPSIVPQAMKSRASCWLNPGPVFVALHGASPPDTSDI